ncbi:HD domain-containing protein [Nocardioides psychrotolerans]|uniref:HD domain-containing protein n=1 Tax=Nocardioides psychrotolerans TaxID=1005945 RepID=UPI001478E1D1|nr:HD domain-containing protein [Nocardioides psychrotolerans]
MNDRRTDLGTITWVQQTSGWLSPAERRSLLWPLARAHARNTIGRFSTAVRLNSGRHAYIPALRLVPPNTVLTRAAEDLARNVMPSALVNHSHRTYTFGRALGELEDVDVDDELLFAAAMLHDTGLIKPTGDADFTLTSARIARDVAEQVGLSTTASTTIQTAITLHHSPGVTLSAGPVAYLLSAGAGLDVVGLRSWELPADTLTDAVNAYPRENFKRVFATAFAQEAARVPQGRTNVLHRYGAFTAAIRFAPFSS